MDRQNLVILVVVGPLAKIHISIVTRKGDSMRWLLIGAVAKEADVHVDTVRNYIRRGQLEAVRDSSGRCLFTCRDVMKIREIYQGNLIRRRTKEEQVVG